MTEQEYKEIHEMMMAIIDQVEDCIDMVKEMADD